MAYLMFCSFLATTAPAPTSPPGLMGLPIAGGNHEDTSAIEHTSEPGSTAIAGSGAPGNFIVRCMLAMTWMSILTWDRTQLMAIQTSGSG
jgi:hypothetical protein